MLERMFDAAPGHHHPFGFSQAFVARESRRRAAAPPRWAVPTIAAGARRAVAVRGGAGLGELLDRAAR